MSGSFYLVICFMNNAQSVLYKAVLENAIAMSCDFLQIRACIFLANEFLN